jgi:hypothetical protein
MPIMPFQVCATATGSRPTRGMGNAGQVTDPSVLEPRVPSESSHGMRHRVEEGEAQPMESLYRRTYIARASCWYTVGLGRGMFCVGRVSYCECRQGARSGSKCRGFGRTAFFGIAQIMANSCQSGQRRRVYAAAGCRPGGRGPARWDQGRLTF